MMLKEQCLAGNAVAQRIMLFLLILLVKNSATAQDSAINNIKEQHFKFAVVPKIVDSPFFESVHEGCVAQAKHLSSIRGKRKVECYHVGPTSDHFMGGTVQADIVTNLLWPNTTSTSTIIVDGLAVSVQNETLMAPILKRARQELGIPVVTFDSDADPALSDRQYYIGTDNIFLGQQLARTMETLQPRGGTYGVIGGSDPNIKARVDGLIAQLNEDSTEYYEWEHLPGSPFDAEFNLERAIDQMNEWATLNPTVIVSVSGLPMLVSTDPATNQSQSLWMEFVDEHNQDRAITLLCGDATAHQLDFLTNNYVNGLVGQLPYEMGVKSIDTLYALVQDPNAELGDPEDDYPDDTVTTDVIGTNVLSHTHIPLRLPPIEVDHHLIGNLRYVGITLFGVIAVTSLSFGAWAFLHRKVRVVRVAQPRFLIMIALGVLLMASSMIPLSMDDGGGSRPNCDGDGIGFGKECTAICMAVPWCTSLGFTVAFSALFSKTRRVNKIFHSKTAFGRVQVSEKDVLVPFFVLLFLNVLILICWTIIDPLTYTRVADYGRDGWNRIISTHGQCTCENLAYFLIPLAVVNVSVLLLANWQAYEARDIEAEFAETKYIGICMASMLQASITGVPVLFIVKDNPPAYYLVASLLIFIICAVILIMIFVPKIIFTRHYMGMAPKQQKEYMADVISKTAKASNERFNNKSAEAASADHSSAVPSTPFERIPKLYRLPWMKRGPSNTSSPGAPTNSNTQSDKITGSDSNGESSDGGVMMFIRKSAMILPNQRRGRDQSVDAQNHAAVPVKSKPGVRFSSAMQGGVIPEIDEDDDSKGDEEKVELNDEGQAGIADEGDAGSSSGDEENVANHSEPDAQNGVH